MSSLVLYELDPAVRSRLRLPDTAVPVRKDHAWEIFQGSTVRLDRLVEEVDAVVAGDAALTEVCAGFLARVARIAAGGLVEQDDFERALEILDIGLKHDPASLRLHAARAACLQALGRPSEAVLAYRRVAWNPDFDGSPLLLVMAARAALDAGERDSALEYLKACPAEMLRSGDFVGLVEAAGGVVERPVVCSTCGREQDPDNDFCPKCGTPIERA